MVYNNKASDLMSCLEVWGGNDIVDRDIEMLGLDAWVYSRPYGSSAHGGDVYYLSSCATGRIIRFLVADVSGHGKSVEKPAATMRKLMKRYINQINQKNFVKAMNQALADFSTGGLFATTIVSTYFAPTCTLTLTNAGHPPPVYFEAKTLTWRLLQTAIKKPKKPTDIPLGVLSLSEYKTQSMRIHQGDIVLCYTDALIECKDSSGEPLGEQGLCDILNHLENTAAAELIESLLKKLSELYSGNLKDDDVTLLAISPNLLFETAYKTPGLKKHMEIMSDIMRKIFSKGEPVPWPDLHPANIGGAMFKILNRLWGRKIK